MTRLPREKLEEIRARVEDVTKGPWWVRANRELVDACVRDIPALLGHVEALEKEILALKDCIQPLGDVLYWDNPKYWKNPTPDKEGA